MLTQEDVRKVVDDAVNDIIDQFEEDADTHRDDVIERLDEECDAMFGNMVQYGLISDYDVDDMVSTAGDCAMIIKVAEEDAWVEDDRGLWEGASPYGTLATIAFFSLRNLLYSALEKKGHDTNDDYPFAREDDEEE